MLLVSLTGCAYKTSSGKLMLATPNTEATWEDGAGINTKFFPDDIIMK